VREGRRKRKVCRKREVFFPSLPLSLSLSLSLLSPLSLINSYLLRRPRVQHVHWEGPPRDLEHGSVPEERREPSRVQGGGGDDEPEIARPAGRDGFQNAEEHVSVERALVGLVHDDGGVVLEVRVAEGLAEEHA
jgi:hypothetical protein